MPSIKMRLLLSLGSFVFFLILIEMGLRLGGYVYVQKLLLETRIEKNEDSGFTILSVGDSYTVGGEGDWRDSYPLQLQKLLTEKHSGNISVINGGICESNSTQVKRHLSKLIKEYKVDSVILLVGASNRFNLEGFSQNKIKNILLNLRTYKLVRIFITNLKGKILKDAIQKHVKKRLSNRNYKYSNVGGRLKSDVQFCTQQEKKRYEGEIGSIAQKSFSNYKLANCYFVEKKFLQAEILYKQIASNPVYFVEANAKLAQSYQEQRKYKDAQIVIEKLIEHLPNEFWTYQELANSYLEEKRYKEAEVVLKEAPSPETEFERNDRREWLAWVYFKENKFDEAIDLFFESIAFEVNNYTNYYFLLKAYELQNKYDTTDILQRFYDLEKNNLKLENNEIFQKYISLFKNRQIMQGRNNAWLKRDLERIVYMCKKSNIQLVIQNYPYPYHSVNRILKDIAEKYSLPFVDNYSVFSKFPSEDVDKYFLNSDHNTKEGHRVMADNIHKVLLEEGIVGR